MQVINGQLPNSVSVKARCPVIARSAPLSSGATGGVFRRGCLSPKGEFRAGRLLRAAQGSHPLSG